MRSPKISSINDRTVFDVYDNTAERFYFKVGAGSALVFKFTTDGLNEQDYTVPAGTEDALFGLGKSLNVQLAWDNGTLRLYLNGALVQTAAYARFSKPGQVSAAI